MTRVVDDSVAGVADAPYRPRSVRFLSHARTAGWRLKVYGIALPGSPVSAAFTTAALDAAGRVLPAPAVAEGRPGIGFVIAHRAPVLAYVLVSWWAERNELHQRILSAPAETPERLTPHAGDAIGCVWELSVTDFERRAWLRDVLANPNGPHLSDYLSREYNDDV